MKLHEFVKKENEGKWIRRLLWDNNSKIKNINNQWIDEQNNICCITPFDINANDWCFVPILKEFNLSEKISEFTTNKYIDGVLSINEVKEFIKLDWELLNDLMMEKITWGEYIEKKKKLVGDKLI